MAHATRSGHAGEKMGAAGPLLALGLTAPLAGLGAGIVGALFRLAIDEANRLRDHAIAYLHSWGPGGAVLLVAFVSAAVAVSAWLVRRVAPSASGSGIPRVIGVLNGEVAPAPVQVVPVKFVAGTLAIGSGLALGREGPSVQMGASIAYRVGRLFRLSAEDCRALLAAGAGAGFATAFNAPVAGTMFVLEALVKRFETRIAIAALAASAVAIWVGRALLGNVHDFSVVRLVEPSFAGETLFVLMGAAAGLAGMLYDRTVLAGLGAVDRLARMPVEVRAALVGAAVGTMAWFAPSLVGSGDPLAAQALSGVGGLAVIPLVFVLRLGLISSSVAAGTPGGLLVPFLALGAELGLWCGKLFALVVPGIATPLPGFALVGMAALFTGIVRAPLTAIILVTEMTGNTSMLLPMLVACSAAMLVPTLFGDVPILDALRQRLRGT